MYTYLFHPSFGEKLDQQDFVASLPLLHLYINSDLYVSVLDDSHLLIDSSSGGHKVEEISPEASSMLQMESKVVLRGIKRMNPEGLEYWSLTHPWKVHILHSPEPLKGLVPYEGKLSEYFFKRAIGIFGGPGTGKSCFSRALTNYLCIELGCSADNAYEFATTHIARWGAPDYYDQIWLMLKQWQREIDIADHKQVLVSDCPHPMTYIYAVKAAPSRGCGTNKSVAWLHEMALRGLNQFDIKIFLPYNSEFCKDDGIRLHNTEQSLQISNWIKDFLDDSGCDYLTVNPTDDLGEIVQKIFLLNL